MRKELPTVGDRVEVRGVVGRFVVVCVDNARSKVSLMRPDESELLMGVPFKEIAPIPEDPIGSTTP